MPSTHLQAICDLYSAHNISQHAERHSERPKKSLNVCFTDVAEVETFPVFEDMWRVSQHARDSNYSHEEWLKKITPEEAESKAFKPSQLEDQCPVEDVALAANAVEGNVVHYVTPEEWLSDTGTPLDLIGKAHVDARLIDFTETMENPLRFQTANNITSACKRVEMQIAPLDENIIPVILDSLSLIHI